MTIKMSIQLIFWIRMYPDLSSPKSLENVNGDKEHEEKVILSFGLLQCCSRDSNCVNAYHIPWSFVCNLLLVGSDYLHDMSNLSCSMVF